MITENKHNPEDMENINAYREMQVKIYYDKLEKDFSKACAPAAQKLACALIEPLIKRLLEILEKEKTND